MSDETARLSARRVATTDDVETRARALADQLRCGVRSVGDVELLAYVGDPVALLVLGEEAPQLLGDDGAVLWMRGFSAWGDEVLARAVVAWLRSVFATHPWGDPPARARFGDEVDRWWSDPERGPPELDWVHGLGRAALELHLALSRYARGEPAEVRLTIEEARWDQSRPAVGLPSPFLVAPQLSAWLLASRPSFAAVQGSGPVWRRAVDTGTPPVRRALVAYLRSHQARERSAPALLDGRPVEITVDHAGFEFLTGFIGRSPMTQVAMERLALP